MATGTIKRSTIKSVEILSVANVPSTATSYACNWSIYDLLLVQTRYYGNIRSSNICSVDYFDTTSDGRRIYALDTVSNYRYEIYKDGNNAVMVLQNGGTPDSRYGIYIYGIKMGGVIRNLFHPRKAVIAA